MDQEGGKRDQPVNFVGQGFLNAAASAITGKPAGSFETTETASIVAGAPSSQFTIAEK